MDANQISLTILAFGLGFMHSFDADHIMAVTNLVNGNTQSEKSSLKNSIAYCLRWSVGHALTLISIGICVFVLGLTIPAELSWLAESVVAVILIMLGGYVLFDVIRRRLHIHFHQHDHLPEHAHWHSHHEHASHRHKHAALFVGVLHGLAGSAPLLALIPVSMKRPAAGLIYLVLFSLGVLISMLLFGGLLGFFSTKIIRYSQHIFQYVRMFLGLGAISVGSVLLWQTL